MTNTNQSFILGIGNDIIEIERIRGSINTHGARFLAKLFTTQEEDYCRKYEDPVPHFAGRFSAKEAIVKALGTGFGKQVSWRDIEILNDSTGKPSVHFAHSMKEKLEGTTVLISISHCQL